MKNYALYHCLQGALLGLMATALFSWQLSSWKFWVWLLGWSIILIPLENVRKDDI